MDLPIEIPSSRSWLWGFFALGLAFFALGLAFLLLPHSMRSPLMQHDFAIRLVGLVILIGSTFLLRQIIRRWSSSRPGLVIERSGLIDNSSSLSVGWIDWADITAIREARVANGRILLLETSRPEKYIKRAKTEVAKNARRAHQKFYGSPIAITVGALQVSYQKLEDLLKKTLEAYEQNRKS